MSPARMSPSRSVRNRAGRQLAITDRRWNAFIEGLIEHRAKGVVPPPLLEGARARMGEATGSPALADRIEAFFRHPRGAQAA